jgi:hypothetical protein
VLSFGFVFDLVPHAFQANGSLSAADFLAQFTRPHPLKGPAWLVSGGVGVAAFVYAWATSGTRRRQVAIVVGGVLLMLGLILLIIRPEWQTNSGDWFG